MLSIILLKVLLDEYIKDFVVNLDMVWERANSKTWKILATEGTSTFETHVLLHVKGCYKAKIICNFLSQLIRQQDDNEQESPISNN